MHTPGSRFCFCRVGSVEEIEHHLIIGRGAHIIAYRHMIRIIKIVLQRRLIGKGFVDAEIECFLTLMMEQLRISGRIFCRSSIISRNRQTTRSCSSAVPFSFQQTICRSIVFTPPAPRTAELYSCSFYRDMLKKSIVKLDFC